MEPEMLPNCLSSPHSTADDLFLLLQALSTIIVELSQEEESILKLKGSEEIHTEAPVCICMYAFFIEL